MQIFYQVQVGTAKVYLLASVSCFLSDLLPGLRCVLVGSLLDVPTHTSNMTTLSTSHELWQSYSMSPYGVNFSLSIH